MGKKERPSFSLTEAGENFARMERQAPIISAFAVNHIEPKADFRPAATALE